MIKKMGLMALGLSMVLLSGCGSSDNDTTNPGTTNPGTTNPGTTNPGTTNPGTETLVFTPELLIGKTYLAIYAGGENEATYAFSETEVTYTEDGEIDILPYTIDGNGVIVFNGGEGTVTLLSADGSGDLHVMESGVEADWTLVS